MFTQMVICAEASSTLTENITASDDTGHCQSLSSLFCKPLAYRKPELFGIHQGTPTLRSDWLIRYVPAPVMSLHDWLKFSFYACLYLAGLI